MARRLLSLNVKQILQKLNLANVDEAESDDIFETEREASFFRVVKELLVHKYREGDIQRLERLCAEKLATMWLDVNLERCLIDVKGSIRGGDGEVSELCVVCLEELSFEEKTTKATPCLHKFHDKCIKSWVRLGKDCPLCREPVIQVTEDSFKLDYWNLVKREYA